MEELKREEKFIIGFMTEKIRDFVS